MKIPEQIAAAERELAMRRRVYPRWVASGKMTQATADHELEAMRAILATLRLIAERYRQEDLDALFPLGLARWQMLIGGQWVDVPPGFEGVRIEP